MGPLSEMRTEINGPFTKVLCDFLGGEGQAVWYIQTTPERRKRIDEFYSWKKNRMEVLTAMCPTLWRNMVGHCKVS